MRGDSAATATRLKLLLGQLELRRDAVDDAADATAVRLAECRHPESSPERVGEGGRHCKRSIEGRGEPQPRGSCFPQTRESGRKHSEWQPPAAAASAQPAHRSSLPWPSTAAPRGAAGPQRRRAVRGEHLPAELRSLPPASVETACPCGSCLCRFHCAVRIFRARKPSLPLASSAPPCPCGARVAVGTGLPGVKPSYSGALPPSRLQRLLSQARRLCPTAAEEPRLRWPPQGR